MTAKEELMQILIDNPQMQDPFLAALSEFLSEKDFLYKKYPEKDPSEIDKEFLKLCLMKHFMVANA